MNGWVDEWVDIEWHKQRVGGQTGMSVSDC